MASKLVSVLSHFWTNVLSSLKHIQGTMLRWSYQGIPAGHYAYTHNSPTPTNQNSHIFPITMDVEHQFYSRPTALPIIFQSSRNALKENFIAWNLLNHSDRYMYIFLHLEIGDMWCDFFNTFSYILLSFWYNSIFSRFAFIVIAILVSVGTAISGSLETISNGCNCLYMCISRPYSLS